LRSLICRVSGLSGGNGSRSADDAGVHEPTQTRRSKGLISFQMIASSTHEK
jgi:hypothetical protein